MADVWMKRGDLLPTLRIQLTSAGSPIDLADAVSAVLFVRQIHGTELLVDGAGVTILDPADVDGELGWVEHEWEAGETEVAGGYFAEVQVTWPAGLPSTFPNDKRFTVAILDDLGGEES